MTILSLDHVQLAMPPGGEHAARTFYGALLGLEEIPKPANLAARGGVWFARGDVRVHLGVEKDFMPARKAHPGLHRRTSCGTDCNARGRGGGGQP